MGEKNGARDRKELICCRVSYPWKGKPRFEKTEILSLEGARVPKEERSMKRFFKSQ